MLKSDASIAGVISVKGERSEVTPESEQWPTSITITSTVRTCQSGEERTGASDDHIHLADFALHELSGGSVVCSIGRVDLDGDNAVRKLGG
jgi:hypothetical protein